ncbi:MAG: FAD-binding protein [Bacteroidetes bacterium]|nr:FAD-binding protein [Bacteroidota bacterium]
MIKTERIKTNEFSTWHQTGPFKVDLLYRAVQIGNKDLEMHNESTAEIQKLLAECQSDGKRFRAFGSLWSLNDVAFNGGRLHSNTDLDMRLQIDPQLLHQDAVISHDNLVFAQCGATVNQLSAYLEKHNKSLKVSGGSNGQTIAGAISTGVHGGAFDYQCISDYVKGLHLVIGPKPTDLVYLERASESVLSDQFAQLLNSRIIRDDDIFNAAIVGLGSFGFIAAVILEVEDIFSLKRYVREIEYDVALDLMQNLDFSNSKFKIDKELDDNNVPIRPYHFKTYVNQYTKRSVAEVIYKIPYKKVNPPVFEIESQLHPDIFRLMQWALDKSEGKVIKLLTKLLQGSAMPNPKKEKKPVTGTLGDIFHSVDFIQPSFSWAIGVDNRQLIRAMDVFLNIFKTYKAPGLSAIKLVRQSKATLGFTKFPITAIIHMDGIQWEASGNLWPQKTVEEEIVKAFVNNNIEFTLHWGKNACWEYPGLIDTMYQFMDDEWVKQRSRLLTYEMAEMFSNDFLRRLNLAGYNRNIDIV